MKRIIISVTNDLVSDQRVNKVANTLSNAGFSVLLVGRRFSESVKLSPRNYSTYRLKMFFQKGFLFYLEYNIRLCLFLLTKKSDILLSNDLDTLCANYFVSKIRKIKLVYDSHELFTELPELIGRTFKKKIWLFMEKFFLRRISNAYTVSNSIARYYKDKYDINMSVIANYPVARKINSQFVLKNKKIIIYQGAINKDRGIDLMIESMLYVNAELHLIGDGDLLLEMREHVERLNLGHKVFFKGKVAFGDLFDITKEADLGLSFEDNTCLSYRYALPNKIFDYINAEVPILISDLPEFRCVLKSYKVGAILASRDIQSVARQINQLLSIPKSTWSAELLKAKKEYDWLIQEKKLLSFFY